MKIAGLAYAFVFIIALSIGVVVGSDVQAQEYKPKAEVTALYEGASTVADGKTIIVKHFTLPAGYVGGKHFHPADVFVYVVEGEFVVETDAGIQTIRAGELYPEVPGMTMLARNPSTESPIKIVVFQVGDTGKPMMIKAE